MISVINKAIAGVSKIVGLISPAPASPPAAITNETRYGLAELHHILCTHPYSDTEKAAVFIHLRKARKEIGYGHDIRVTDEQSAPAIGRIVLSSRNFGYDFALLNVTHGSTSHVEIYRSNQGSDKYTRAAHADDVGSALKMIDKMYRDAAKAHLP